jgi:hypothetical protein
MLSDQIFSLFTIPVVIRGLKVMLDMDLAELYGVETKQLKRAVRRNEKRFPPDFMFELSKDESENLGSQSGASNREKMDTDTSAAQNVAMSFRLTSLGVR